MMSLLKQSETNTAPFAWAVHDTPRRSLVSSVLGRSITMAEAEMLAADAGFVRWLDGLARREHESGIEDSN